MAQDVPDYFGHLLCSPEWKGSNQPGAKHWATVASCSWSSSPWGETFSDATPGSYLEKWFLCLKNGLYNIVQLGQSLHPAADTLIDVRFGQSSRGVLPDPARHSAQKKRKQNKIVDYDGSWWVMSVQWWVMNWECWIVNDDGWRILNINRSHFRFTVNGSQRLWLCPV